MKVIRIDKTEWNKGLTAAAAVYRLLGPVNKGEDHEFGVLEEGVMPDLDMQNTRLSPKALIYPQSQAMFTYSLDESREDHHIMRPVEPDTSPRAIVGVRPCDASAFLLVQRNFDTPDYKDPYWITAYEATTFVGYACDMPCSTCFCTSSGCGPYHEAGLDALLVDLDDAYLLKVLTEKGERFAEAAGWEGEADSGAEKQIESLRQAAEEKITASISTDELREKGTLPLYDAPFWEDVGFPCINCGTCTYVCPTCWCFDIQDENSGKRGVRLRNWDSCMYPLFTLHGTGHNPRENKIQRARQRFMHKLKYYVDKYEDGIQCVGCGRCIRLCPVNIDIRTIAGLMNDYESDGESAADG